MNSTMKEKKYPILDEEENIDVASEPAVATSATQCSQVQSVHTGCDFIDDLDWDRLPILGPKTEEEAISRIDEFEEKLAKRQVKWYSSEEVDRMLYEKYPGLR